VVINSISTQLNERDNLGASKSAQQAAKAIAKVESARNTVASLRIDLRKLRADASRDRSPVKASEIKRRITRTTVRLAKARSTLRARYNLLVNMGLVNKR
jgi:hypothetical protein